MRTQMKRTLLAIMPMVLASCSLGPAPSGTATTPARPAPPQAAETTFASRVLGLHNAERVAVGTPPLVWDSGLAASAQDYAETLARTGVLQHSPRDARPSQRENLWMGPRGIYDVEAMVGGWTAEKAQFRPGIFPNVSRTGNWADVAHYTAMIWRDTQRLGCALASSATSDFLVCRYTPAGNIDGRPVP